ncbi:redoxin family protein [Flavobacterium sp. Sd200]|nr:redoxin family protein [Flavobacterium sp. Sd200]
MIYLDTYIKRYSLFAVLIFSVLTLVCCKKESGEEEKEQPDTTAVAVKDTIVAPKLPTPLKIYTNDTVSVPAYDYAGLEYFLKQKNDTTYVVNFWATWCVPCVEELPHFEKINAKYKANKVKVILVSLDMAKMIEKKLLPFITEKRLKSQVLLLRDTDADAWIPKVDSTWSGAIPATVIYNSDARKFYERSFTYDELEKEISNFK